MNFFQSLFPGLYNTVRSRFGFSSYDASVNFNDSFRTRQKLQEVLKSPALLKVISLQCDLFSLGEIYVQDKKTDELLPDDPFLTFIGNPNPDQSKQQFLWDFMFWLMLGTDYCLSDTKVLDPAFPMPIMYHLDPSKIEWPQKMEKERDHMTFDRKAKVEMGLTEVIYRYDDGTVLPFVLNRLVTTNDLTNGVGNFYKGPNRIDALYKIITNADKALDSKNINVRYLGKFLVGSNTTDKAIGLSNEEKDDIKTKLDQQDVFPLKSLVQIKRFVESIGTTGLDQAYLADYFLIGNMYGIPRDVLEAYVSATYENQEKARMAHVSYTLQPKGNDWMNALEKFFGYDKTGKNIYISWDHLPFMQVFEKDRADKEAKKVETFGKMREQKIPLEEINRFLDTSFTIEEEVTSEPVQTSLLLSEQNDKASWNKKINSSLDQRRKAREKRLKLQRS